MTAQQEPPRVILQIALDIGEGLKAYTAECRVKGVIITIPELLRALDYVQAELTEIWLDQHPEAMKSGI